MTRRRSKHGKKLLFFSAQLQQTFQSAAFWLFGESPNKRGSVGSESHHTCTVLVLHGKQSRVDVLVSVRVVEKVWQTDSDAEVSTGRAALHWNNSWDLNSSCITFPACSTQTPCTSKWQCTWNETLKMSQFKTLQIYFCLFCFDY